MTKECDILILGAGPAGLTAGLYAARAGAKTIIVENMAAGGAIISTSHVGNYPGIPDVSGSDLGEKMREQAEAAGAEIIYDEIGSIDFSGNVVRCSTWSEAPSRCAGSISYKALIICTGTTPRKLDVPGEEEFFGSGVHTCALCDGNFYRGKDVVVVGGGRSAVHEAIYLAAIAKTVTIVNITEDFNAKETLVDKLNSLANLKVFHSHKVTKVLGDKKVSDIEIQNVITNETQIIDTNGVFVVIGRNPNTELLGGKIELSKGGYIKVNDKLQTNIAGVFAAGDVTEKHVRQVITACSDGAVAATHAVEHVQQVGR